MLSKKILHSGDVMARATSLSIVELKLSTPVALYGFRCNSFFSGDLYILEVLHSLREYLHGVQASCQ